MGILISQYKDPYKPTSIMESKRVFFVAHIVEMPPQQLENKTRGFFTM